MAKRIKTIYVCSKCDSQFPKWLGRCPECGSWGTLAVQSAAKVKSQSLDFKSVAGEVVGFDQVRAEDFKRIRIGIEEFDRVLGGGIVFDSVVLIGGEPGIGKSTLILQVADKIRGQVLYVSGEESAEQIKMRLDRLGLSSDNLKFLGETDVEVISATIQKERPTLAIIDSIQTMHWPEIPSASGSVAQVRTCTGKLLEIAKEIHLPIFIIGHVTKGGLVAGPKTLEHLVDTVLYLEGDRQHHFRILRASKNRFGSTNEVGVFDMQSKGLIEVNNPSEVFLSGRQTKTAGSVITAIIEGTRAFLIEVQSLVSRTSFGYPQRKCAGFDFNRLQLLIAVLVKRCGLFLGNQDIHVNVVGGIQVRQPAADLAVALAIASAFKNKAIDPKLIAFGEVGLGGEVRAVNRPEARIKEAEKMGFEAIICPVSREIKSRINIIQVKNLREAIEAATS
jgi:DNA repair protein RadA/Sms